MKQSIKPIDISSLPSSWDINGFHVDEYYEIPIDISGPVSTLGNNKGTVVAMDEGTITIKFDLPRLRAMIHSN